MWQSNRMLHSATYQCNASKYRNRKLIYGRSLGLSLYPEERRLPESTSRCDVGRKKKKIMNWFWIERAILHFPHSTVSRHYSACPSTSAQPFLPPTLVILG